MHKYWGAVAGPPLRENIGLWSIYTIFPSYFFNFKKKKTKPYFIILRINLLILKCILEVFCFFFNVQINKPYWQIQKNFLRASQIILKLVIFRFHDYNVLKPALRITEDQTGLVPMPGIEPEPAGWKPAILATRPHGMRLLLLLLLLWTIDWCRRIIQKLT